MTARFGRCGLRRRSGVLRTEPVCAVSALREPAAIAIARALEMDALWDDAAEALSKGDFAGFDQAMLRFREIRQQREPGAANNRPGRNS